MKKIQKRHDGRTNLKKIDLIGANFLLTAWNTTNQESFNISENIVSSCIKSPKSPTYRNKKTEISMCYVYLVAEKTARWIVAWGWAPQNKATCRFQIFREPITYYGEKYGCAFWQKF